MEFMIGADPEFFITSPEGALKSAIPLIPGTKHNQFLVDGGGLQRDNVAAEFSCDPTSSEDAFVGIIGKMISHLDKQVSPNKLLLRSSADFPFEELADDEAMQFGCDPDFNAWTVSRNVFSIDVAFNSLRSCGGHIHVGTKNGQPKVLAEDETGFGRLRLVKMMDLFVGIPSVVLDPDKTAARRRELYGKAGCHRPKPYGVEYRAVGNFWTRSPDSVRLVYRLTSAACMACDRGLDSQFMRSVDKECLTDEAGEAEIQRVINTSDEAAAEDITNRLVAPLMIPATRELFNKVKKNEVDLYDAWRIRS